MKIKCKTCLALEGFVKYWIEVGELVMLWRYFDHRVLIVKTFEK